MTPKCPHIFTDRNDEHREYRCDRPAGHIFAHAHADGGWTDQWHHAFVSGDVCPVCASVLSETPE